MVARIVDTLTGRGPSGVLVGGGGDLMVRFAVCCSPVPGDPIVGFVTRGRGISVHRTDCEHAELFVDNPERSIQVSWDSRASNKYIVFLDIGAQDRAGLLHDITAVFVNFGVNVTDARVRTRDIHAHCTFKIQIQNRNQLRQIIDRVRTVQGVERISRSREPGDAPGAER
jgi:GTP pyrophosphokinase